MTRIYIFFFNSVDGTRIFPGEFWHYFDTAFNRYVAPLCNSCAAMVHTDYCWYFSDMSTDVIHSVRQWILLYVTGLCPTLIEWLRGLFILHSTIDSTAHSIHMNSLEHCIRTTLMTNCSCGGCSIVALVAQCIPTLGALHYFFNSHPLEVVSRYRDPQLQVGENY